MGAHDHSILSCFLGFFKASDISICFIYFSNLSAGLDSCIVYFIENLELFNRREHLDEEERIYFIASVK